MTESTQAAQKSSDYLRNLASFVPDTLIAAANDGVLDDDANPREHTGDAVLLFADISGFTALTEQLSELGGVGAEHLTTVLNRYFGCAIDQVLRHQGDVVKFAGDALMAVWPVDSSTAQATDTQARAVAVQVVECAHQLMAAVNQLALEQAYPLNMKIAVSRGAVRWMYVGGIFDRWEPILTGEPLAELGQCNDSANPGEVVCAPSILTLIRDVPVSDPGSPSPPRGSHRVGQVACRQQSIAPRAAQVVRRYIPGAIRSRIDADQTDWLGERRRVSIVFVNLPQLTSQLPVERAQAAMRAMQMAVYKFEGSINKISVDDKGASLIVAFGMPPLSHQDDPLRAVMAALAIEAALLQEEMVCAIGVCSGHVFCGVIGNEVRREYTVMGDCVNVAARLMQAAKKMNDSRDRSQPAEPAILCDAYTWGASRRDLTFDALDPLLLKGKSSALAVYRPHSHTTLQGQPRRQQPEFFFTGRQRVLDTLTETVAAFVQSPALQVQLIEGELGAGRSALLRAVVRDAVCKPCLSLRGSGDPLNYQTPWHAWQSVFMHLLLPTDQLMDRQARRLAVLAALPQLPDVLRHAPLLEAVIPSGWEDNAHTRGLTGPQRAAATRQLLINILWQVANTRPVMIRLLDIQWFDSASAQLLCALIDEGVPLLLLLTRAHDVVSGKQWLPDFVGRPGITQLALEPMSDAEILSVARHALGVSELPDAASRLLVDRAEGSPLYAEQFACALRDTGLLIIDHGQCFWRATPEAVDQVLPASVEGLITARLDRLSPDEQLTIKVASVIGKEFESTAVSAIHPIHSTVDTICMHCTILDEAALTPRVPLEATLMRTERYRFKSQLMMQITYDMVPASQRRVLHQKHAQHMEQSGQADLPEWTATLAFHWHRASEGATDSDGNLALCAAHAVKYYVRLGHAAARSGAIPEAERAYQQAIELLGRCGAVRVVEDEIDALLGLSTVRVSAYGWADEQAARAFERARDCCTAAGQTERLYKTIRGLWQVAVGRSQYSEAADLSARMMSLALSDGDLDTPMAREALRALGTTRFWRGMFPEAIEILEAATAPLSTGAPTQADVAMGLIQDTEVSARSILAWAYALSGQQERARYNARKALTLSEQGMPAFTRAFARGAAMWTALYLDDAVQAKAYAAETFEISQERGFEYLSVAARVVRGWASAILGDEGSIADIEQAIDDWRNKGQSIGITAFLLQLARACVALDHLERARQILSEPGLLKALTGEPWLASIAAGVLPGESIS